MKKIPKSLKSLKSYQIFFHENYTLNTHNQEVRILAG